MISIIFSAWVLLMTAVLCGIFLSLIQTDRSPFISNALIATVTVLGLAVAIPDILAYPLWALGLLWMGFMFFLYWLPLPYQDGGIPDPDDLLVSYGEETPDIAHFFDFEEVN
jgi:uncharacterized protein (DUF983 family)